MFLKHLKKKYRNLNETLKSTMSIWKERLKFEDQMYNFNHPKQRVRKEK